MAKKSQKISVPKFTSDKQTPKKAVIGKLVVQKCSPDGLVETVQTLLTRAQESGLEIASIKGTLTLY